MKSLNIPQDWMDDDRRENRIQKWIGLLLVDLLSMSMEATPSILLLYFCFQMVKIASASEGQSQR